MSVSNEQAKKPRIGFTEDMTGGMTMRVEIIAETTDGRLVCRRHTSEMITRPWDGTEYMTENFSPLFLKDKNEVEARDE